MIRSSVLVVSLGLNLVLGAVLVWFATRQPSESSSAKAATATAAAPAVAHPPSIATVKWSDSGTWVGQLRAAGAPNDVLANLLAATFDAQWEKRRQALQDRWDAGELDDDAWADFNRQHDIELEASMRSALGEEGFLAWHKAKLLAGLHLGRLQLSSAETDAIYALRRDLLQQQRDLDRKRRAGEVDDAHVSDLQDKLELDYQTKLKTVLGDDRYATLQRATDSVEGGIRRTLQALNMPAAQIDAAVEVERQWRDRRAQIDHEMAQDNALTPETYQSRLHALDVERDAALQRQLGADAFDAFRQQQDERYRKLTRYAQLWQLTPSEIEQVYGTLRDYGQSVEEYRRQALSRGVNWDATQQAIEQFRQNTATSLRNALGEAKYKQLAASEVLDWDH